MKIMETFNKVRDKTTFARPKMGYLFLFHIGIIIEVIKTVFM